MCTKVTKYTNCRPQQSCKILSITISYFCGECKIFALCSPSDICVHSSFSSLHPKYFNPSSNAQITCLKNTPCIFFAMVGYYCKTYNAFLCKSSYFKSSFYSPRDAILPYQAALRLIQKNALLWIKIIQLETLKECLTHQNYPNKVLYKNDAGNKHTF